VSETTFSPRRNALAVALLVLKWGEEGFMTTFCRNSMRYFVLAALFVSMCGALAFAQSTTDGAIGGTVYDTSGAVVASAQILVHNNGTNAEKTAATDSSGYFRIANLAPGTYTVTITREGFAQYKAEQVIVEVGSITEVSPRLVVGGGKETVEVTAEAPQINYTSPEFAPTLNQEAISNLPINGGRWSSFALLTPGVVSNVSGFGLLSFRGISTLLNNNTIDGADNNQAFFSEERGRTRIGYSSPQAAVEEFQVNTSNYSAEYGRSAGGVVNTVTKSGTNTIHGEAYFYDRDNVWGAKNPFTKINVQTAPGTFTPVIFKPTDWRKRAGLGVGGALVKDKLFWFLAFDWYKRNFPGTAVASNPTVFFATQTTASSNIDALARRLNGLLPVGGTAPTAAQLNAALGIWNSDLAGLNTMLGPLPRTGEQNIIFPKIDWKLNQKNNASFTFNRMRWSSPAGIQTQATNTNGIASFGNDYVKDTWGVAKLVSLLTNNLSNEVRYQYGRDFEFEFTQPPTPYEVANLVNAPSFTNPLGLPPQVSITNGFTFGVPSFLQRAKFPDETRQQLADTVTWIHRNHSIKFGADFSHVHDISINLRNQFGSYSYSSLLNYFSDFNTPRGCSTTSSAPPSIPCYTSFNQAFGPLGFEFNTNDMAFFLQDDWKIRPRLSLSFGVRYEYQMLPDPFSNLVNPAVPQTGKMPNDKNNFGPRVGFAWGITGNGKTVLRGGYGIYYGRIINSTIFNALTNTAMPGSQVTFPFNPTTTSPVFPTILSSAPPPSPTARPNILFFDSNFQNPQIHQLDLTLEQDLGWGTVLSVSYLGSLGRELPNFADINIAPSTGTLTYQVIGGGPLKGPYTTPVFGTRPNASFGAMTDIFSGVNSNYQALAVQVNHRMSHNIQFGTNYTWSHSIDFGQNESTFSDTNDLLVPFNLAADKGNSIYDVRQRLVLNAVINSPWKRSGWAGVFANGWGLSPLFQIQTGLPYSLGTSGNAPGSLPFGGGGVNGSGGAFRISAVGRNTFRFPTTWVQDLRVSKEFKFRERYGLELLGDFFNLANHSNVTNVSMRGYSVATTGGTCTALSPCLNFDPTFGRTTNINSNFSYSPRQVQLGLRVKF
jgi:hypothetical protein